MTMGRSRSRLRAWICCGLALWAGETSAQVPYFGPFVSEQAASRYEPVLPAYFAPDAVTSTVVPMEIPASEIPHPIAAVAPSDSPSVGSSESDLAARLFQAESRIKQLEGRQAAAAQADAKAATLLQSIQERWDQVQDPSITTVDQQTHDVSKKKPSETKWYDRLSVRGYAQLRWNEVVERNEALAPAQAVGDRSIGDDQSFLIRRARLIVSGDVSDRMYVYLQPDFANTPSGSPDGTFFAQIRDWYADIYLDDRKVNRFRLGQSKLPYGWENMQSSSNRLALDRSDGINSSVRNERDLGVFYYWTPEPAQDFFKDVLDLGLKGSGNYGVFGVGIYNGQGGSLLEQNDDIHVVTRLTIPYRFAGGQFCEFGIQGYTGRFTVLSSQIRPLGVGGLITPAGTLENSGRRGHLDERIAASFIWYPQPIGFQSEWNVGRGPGLNNAQTAVEERALYGGYVQTMLKYDTRNWGTFFPFIRWSQYQGGYKQERNAPFSNIEEVDAGTEWQINPQMELTTSWLIVDRTNTTAFTGPGVQSYQQFEGSVLRFQFQFNY
jgi:hypothetical protein